MFNYTVGRMSCQQLTINITMLKYIQEWIKDYNAVQREFNEMGYFTISTWFGSWTHIDKEMYKKYNDKQRQISNSNNQSKKQR